MSDQVNTESPKLNHIESEQIREKIEEATQPSPLTAEQNLNNAHALKILSTMFTTGLNQSIVALCEELDRIIDSVDHARSTLPGSPNPADVGMSIIVKLGKIAKQIKEQRVTDIVGSCGSTASIIALCLEQAQRAQIGAYHSAIAANNTENRITTQQSHLRQLAAFIGFELTDDNAGVPEAVGLHQNYNDLHAVSKALCERSNRLEAVMVKIANKLEINLHDLMNSEVADDAEPIPLKLDDSGEGTPASGASNENNPDSPPVEAAGGGEPATETTQQA